jgi:DNA-binding HxlR family transcriptional regulator
MGKLIENLAEGGGECGLPHALEAMGERWSFMILRAAFNGLKHFEEMQASLGIARNILANRLGRLVATGILERQPCPDDRRKIEYRLTQWGERWGDRGLSNPVLCDARDRQPVQRVRIHAHDGRALDWHDLTWVDQSEVVSEAAE